MIKKSINTFLNIIQLLLIAVLVLSVSLIIFTAFSPIKKFQIFRVMSGSMEPTVKAGSIILVEKIDPQKLELRDIIAFSQTNDKNVVVTHRLLEAVKKEGQVVFLTKGDANKDTNEEVLSSQIKGKVIFSVPFLGYLSAWLKTPLGLLLLVFLPALLVIINEIFSIKNIIEEEIRKKYENKKEGNFENVDGTKSTNFVIPAAIILFVILFRFNPIHAFFSSTITASNNSFTMGTWTTPTPTPTSTPIANHLVINEVYYRISNNHRLNGGESGSEWAELYNPTGSTITLNNWSIKDNTSCDDIPASVIPSNSYAIISTHSESEFRNIWTSVPQGVVFIQSPTAIGNGLANNDELMLQSGPCPNGPIADHISWGSNTNGLNPSVPMVPSSGISSERYPDGIDTNTNADFIQSNPPTPGT